MACPKVACLLHLLCLAAPGVGQASDATVLLQSQLADPALTPGGETAEAAPAAAASGPVENDRLSFRLVVTRTRGNDHFCLNELTFEDEFVQPLEAEYESMSTCYGCATSCKGCATEYGNTVALFDGKSDEDDAKWICSEHGGYNGTGADEDGTAYGEQMIAFTLKQRAFRFAVHVKQAGSYMPRDWHLQEWLKDRESWSTISQVENADEFKMQWATVSEGSLSLATNYPIGWQVCCQGGTIMDMEAGRQKKVPIALNFEAGADARFDLRLRSQDGRSLMNNGHGAQIQGDFGFLNYTDTLFSISQVGWHVGSSSFQLPNGDTAAGEMHIVTRSLGGKFVVINLLLQMPTEHESLDTATETRFLELGLAAIPEEGSPRAIGSFDLSVFQEYFDGGYVHLPCEARPDVTWLILRKPAMVSGVIIQAFQTRFPNPLAFWNEDAAAPAVGNPSEPQLVKDWTDFRLSDEAQAKAYQVGEWARGPQIIWEGGVASVEGEKKEEAAPSGDNNSTISEEPVTMNNAIISEGLGA